jgi:hypothetical protein
MSLQLTHLPSIPVVHRAVTQPGTTHVSFLIVGLVSLVAINILFIADIELTLRRNKGDQTGDEATWGFGQVLALLLLIIPLRDAWGALQDIWEKLAGVQNRCAEFLGRICQATPVIEEFEHLIKDGAKPNESLCLAGITFGNALQLVAYHGKIELVQSLQLVQSLEQQGISDIGTIPTSNYIYIPNYFKVDNFTQHSSQQQQGGMFSW